MKWIVRAYSLALLGYTGWRTFDFMSAQLPTEENNNLIALLFLFATEVGLILWHEISQRHTTTEAQHYLSIALTWVDFAGSLGAGIADMILRQTFIEGYQVPPLLGELLIYGLPLAVALNVAGYVIFMSNDADTQIETAKRQLRFEITKQALKDIGDHRGAIAEEMKANVYNRLRSDVTGQVIREFTQTPEHYQEKPAIWTQDPASLPHSGNNRPKVKERT